MAKVLPMQQKVQTLQGLKGRAIIVDYITGYEERHVKAGQLEEITEDFLVLRAERAQHKIFLGRGPYPTQAVLDISYLTDEGVQRAYMNEYYWRLINTQGTLARKQGVVKVRSRTYSCRLRGK